MTNITEQIFTPKLLSIGSTWQQPGNTGNTGGGSVDPHGTFTISQALGVSVQPAIAAANQKWDTFFFYNNLESHPEATRLAQAITFTFPTQADIDACEAVEWQLEKCIAGNIWNMGWQLRLGTRQVGRFDYTRNLWDYDSSIPFPTITPNVPLEFHTEHICTASDVSHVALWINDVRAASALTQPVFLNKWPDKPTYLQYAFQLDSKGQGAPFTVKVETAPVKYL